MKKYRSEICEALHEDTLALFRHGIISEAELREFEAEAFIEDDAANDLAAPLGENPVMTEHEIA